MQAADPFPALQLWRLDWRVVASLALIFGIYLRGWLRVRQRIRYAHDNPRLAAFVAGLALLYIAACSPLDALDETYVSAHMAQHLILMMLAPGLILLGHPILPVLRGLPRRFVRRVLRPVLTWRGLRRFFEALSAPPAALAVYAISTVAWHIPSLYELAVESEAWHAVEHACFLSTGLLFWWPVIRPGFGRSRWPEWIGIPYLLLGDVLNTVLSAFFVFSGRVLYPSYAEVQNAARPALDDQILAGAIMWVPGSIVYLVPAVVIAIRLLSPVRYTARPVVRT